AFLAALRFFHLNAFARWASLAVLLGVTAGAVYEAVKFQSSVIFADRNFYGVLRVKEYGGPGTAYHLRRLVHGVIMHGEQNIASAEERRQPTTYYMPSSGIAGAIESKKERGPLRLGVIGLGAGTLAAYGRKGDAVQFYEI